MGEKWYSNERPAGGEMGVMTNGHDTHHVDVSATLPGSGHFLSCTSSVSFCLLCGAVAAGGFRM